jgi:uncharacterized caspase-like protein
MIVGNGQYQHVSPLAHPDNDARVMSQRLESLGWRVTTVIDVGTERFEEAIRSFEEKVVRAEQAIFYYAGYGMQINGENYIVPVEFDPAAATIDEDLIALNRTIERLMQAEAQLVILLDACRDNPLASAYERVFRRKRSTFSLHSDVSEGGELYFGKGLAELPAHAGMFVAFSTAPGHVALDGTLEHSPFTRSLLDHIGEPNQDVTSILRRVREDVVRSTGGSQVPWDQSYLNEAFLLYSEPSSDLEGVQPN